MSWQVRIYFDSSMYARVGLLRGKLVGPLILRIAHHLILATIRVCLRTTAS
jgi:hypothetical protein